VLMIGREDCVAVSMFRYVDVSISRCVELLSMFRCFDVSMIGEGGNL